MQTTRETYDNKGNLLKTEAIEIPDVASQPSKIEIRLAALEAKVGITEDDKTAALETLMSSKELGVKI